MFDQFFYSLEESSRGRALPQGWIQPPEGRAFLQTPGDELLRLFELMEVEVHVGEEWHRAGKRASLVDERDNRAERILLLAILASCSLANPGQRNLWDQYQRAKPEQPPHSPDCKEEGKVHAQRAGDKRHHVELRKTYGGTHQHERSRVG